MKELNFLSSQAEFAMISPSPRQAINAMPETILAIAEAFRELEQRAEAAEALNNHLELAVRKAEGVSESLRRRAEDAENKLLFTRAAPAAVPVDLVSLVPPAMEAWKVKLDPHGAAVWDACCAEMLRLIEDRELDAKRLAFIASMQDDTAPEQYESLSKGD